MLKIMLTKTFDSIMEYNRSAVEQLKNEIKQLKDTDYAKELSRVQSNFANYKRDASLLKRFIRNKIYLGKTVYFIQDGEIANGEIKAIELNNKGIMYKISNNYKLSGDEIFTNKNKCLKYLTHILNNNINTNGDIKTK